MHSICSIYNPSPNKLQAISYRFVLATTKTHAPTITRFKMRCHVLAKKKTQMVQNDVTKINKTELQKH